MLTEFDLQLLAEGRHERAYEKLGAHPTVADGVAGVSFAVVAPHAERVAVIGDFNGWDAACHPMAALGDAGVWHRFVPGVEPGTLYKFRLRTRAGEELYKADPFAFAAELRPRSASRVHGLRDYPWGDADWLADRGGRQHRGAPISIYEVHLGSWRRRADGSWPSYRELAVELVAYVERVGYTHVELLPIVEHPLDASWGYQATGYYAPTSRFGTPDDFSYLVDTLHQAGIGVILDWVPGHFPDDAHGLATFDGTHLYEYADPREGRHPEWHTQIFNLGGAQTCNLLLSNARFWLDRFHVDGLRVDAVASMLYRDYARGEGEWVPNADGGRENHEAVAFLRRLNEMVYRDYPDVMTFAEESTAWPGVSRPTDAGGLGFGFKWNMGWMNDLLRFAARAPGDRLSHLDELTFSLHYAFSENFVLPLSHDEVVHGKGSMVGKMPGDDWHKLATTRLVYGYMFGHPGKKLLFMGDDIGQRREWDHDGSVDWSLEQDAGHLGLQRWVCDLNRLYRTESRLHALDCESSGFAWVDHAAQETGVLSFLRRDAGERAPLLFIVNVADTVHEGFRVGAPSGGHWTERLNSDARRYGGGGRGNPSGVGADPTASHGHPYSLLLTIPPLSVVVLDPTGTETV